MFGVDDPYSFRHHFERLDQFAERGGHHDDEATGFDVSPAEVDAVRHLFDEHPSEPTLIEVFSVVMERYTKHADILRNSVMHWTRDGYHFFVTQDPLSVEQAVERRATGLQTTDLVLGRYTPSTSRSGTTLSRMRVGA